MKRTVLLIVSLTLILSSLMTFSSCDEEKGENFDDLYEAISIYEDIILDQEELEALDEQTTYVIIIPVDCGAEIFDSAALLSQVMSKNVGYEVKVYYDSDLKPKSTNFEILVGETNREKSQRYAKSLRAYDYGYEYADGAVTIGAHSDTLVAKAVESFSDSITSGETSTVYIKAMKDCSFRSEYDISRVSLCGFPISEYAIVYPKNGKLGEFALAGKLKESLEKYTGYSLPIVCDSEVAESSKFICVGKSSVTTSDVIPSTVLIVTTDSGDVELLAGDNYGINLCIEKFLELIKNSEKEGACDVDLLDVTKISYQNEELSFYLVRDSYLTSDATAYGKVVSEAMSCSLCVFDSLSADVEQNLRHNIELLTGINKNSFYAFDSSKMKCVETSSVFVGGGEIVTIVMENNKGERFAFVGGFNNGSQTKINSAEFRKTLTKECTKLSELPLLVIHELTPEQDVKFAKENPRLEALVAGKGIYAGSDLFEFVSATSSEISAPLFADVVKVKFCFK